MNVILAIGGQVVVDYEGDLLHVDASGEKVGSDEDAGRTGAELAHNHVPLLLVHIAVLEGEEEVKAKIRTYHILIIINRGLQAKRIIIQRFSLP